LIIDEVSFIDAKHLCHIHHRLCEIFQCLNRGDAMPFGGVCVVAMGDALQLPPVLGTSMFRALVSQARVANGHVGSNQEIHGASASDRGLDLWRKFRMIRFERQMRSVDEGHTAFLNYIRQHPDAPISEAQRQYLSQLILSPADLRSDPLFREAPIVVVNNKLRHALNLQQAIRFARARGLPVVRWRIRLSRMRNQMVTQEHEDFIYANSDNALFGLFIQGAPSYLTHNANASRGLANGTFTVQQQLIFKDPDLQQYFDELIAAARPGQIVDLIDMDGFHRSPDAILVRVPSITQADWRAGMEENMARELLDLQPTTDPSAELLVPIVDSPHIKKLNIGVDAKVTVKYHPPACELGFAITFHKGLFTTFIVQCSTLVLISVRPILFVHL
jgi:hypothetical protein